MDLWQMILADHANIKELCREVLRASGSGPNSRASLFADLEDEMERHITAKESVLYPVLEDDERTEHYVAELEQEVEDIRHRLHALASHRYKDTHAWATEFKDLVNVIRHYFVLEENGALMVARGTIDPDEAEEMRRDFEREKIAALEASRWHLPQAMMPSRYGLSSGAVFGVLAGIAAAGAAALAWRTSRQGYGSSTYRPPETSPFMSRTMGRGRRATLDRMAAMGDYEEESDFADRVAASSRTTGAGTSATGASASGASRENWYSSANPPHAPSGISTPLQPGGTAPGGGPGATTGSIGTGGAQTENRDTGGLKRDGQ